MGGGGAAPLIVWQESDLDGCDLDPTFLVDARERVQPVLDRHFAMHIEVLGPKRITRESGKLVSPFLSTSTSLIMSRNSVLYR